VSFVAARTRSYSKTRSSSFRINGDRSKTCSGELTMSRRSSLAGPLALAFARMRIFVSRTILMYACAAQRGGLHRSPRRFLLPEDRQLCRHGDGETLPDSVPPRPGFPRVEPVAEGRQ